MSKSLREFESLYTFNLIGSVFVYNICDVIDYLGLADVEYFESGKKILEFASQFNLSIYSVPKDKFSVKEICELCKVEKTSGVIVEDLS